MSINRADGIVFVTDEQVSTANNDAAALGNSANRKYWHG
jgi:hypothetical protein